MTANGRKDLHERGVKCIADWNKAVVLNKEREVQRQQDEKELQALHDKLIQIQQEKARAMQIQQLQTQDTGVVIGANLNA